MKLQTEHSYTEESFNSNNAWGFGGAIGTRYKFEHDITLTIGKAYYRHADTTPYMTVRVDGIDVLDYSGHGKANLAICLRAVDRLITLLDKKQQP
jgi:hypothetical protein